jgi:hypothetical protein
MTRAMKRFGLVLVAAIALCLVTAASALATGYQFKSKASSTTLVGEQGAGDAFAFDAGEVRCSSTSYSGQMTSESASTVTLTPSYSGCAMGAATATVNMNGCAYKLEPGEVTESSSYDVATNIECPTGKSIVITTKIAGIIKCTITIPPKISKWRLIKKLLALGYLLWEIYEILKELGYIQTEGAGLGKCPTTTETSNGTLRHCLKMTAVVGSNRADRP